MSKSPLERFKQFVTNTDSEPISTTGTTHQSASLYECSDCEEVLIADELQTCPRCEQHLEEVPNGRDMGHV